MAQFTLQTSISEISDLIYRFDRSSLSSVPREPGVYIYGIKKDVDKENCFVPLYVGIYKDLNQRLRDHYRKNSINGSSTKEFFDLNISNTKAQASSLYNSISEYDKHRGLKALDMLDKIPHLIWFNNSRFFDLKLNMAEGTNKYISNSGHEKSFVHLLSKQTPKSDELYSNILNSKNIFQKNFYYCYITLTSIISSIYSDASHSLFSIADDYKKNRLYTISRKNASGKIICEIVENTLKQRLGLIGLFTSAKSTNEFLPETDKFILPSEANFLNLTGLLQNYII